LSRSLLYLITYKNKNDFSSPGNIVTPCYISRRTVKLLLSYGDFSIFKIVCRAPFWIFVVREDHPRRVFGGLHQCAKFDWNRCNSFDNMHICIFHKLGLKIHIHPQNYGFGEFDPRMKAVSTRRTEGTSFRGKLETLYMTYRSSKSVQRRGLGAIPSESKSRYITKL